MLIYKNLVLIGTSHISPESVKEVELEVIRNKPDVVAIELDLARFKAMMSNKKRKISFKDIRKIGVKGFLITLIGGYVERKLGKLTGVAPGSEMIKAIKVSRKINCDLALIDDDIGKVMKRLGKGISWREKLRFVWELIKSPFSRTRVKFDLNKVPSKKVINKLTSKLKEDYPSVYKILIEERNHYLANNLRKLMEKYGKVIGVVGAGHEDEIVNLIKKGSLIKTKVIIISKDKLKVDDVD